MTKETCESILWYYFAEMVKMYKEFSPEGKSVEASYDNEVLTIKTEEFGKTMEREDIK